MTQAVETVKNFLDKAVLGSAELDTIRARTRSGRYIEQYVISTQQTTNFNPDQGETRHTESVVIGNATDVDIYEIRNLIEIYNKRIQAEWNARGETLRGLEKANWGKDAPHTWYVK